MILFLQFYHLSYQQVFWVFTVGSVFSFLIEIPTGVIADMYGKRKSIIFSKFLISGAFVLFGFSSTFWMFVLAQVIYELGQSFRSGTETAYAYDYLAQTKGTPSYTEVKGKQKFYARVGESIATAVGGLIAAWLGYNAVFFFAAVPAFVNFLMNLTWVKIKEKRRKIGLKSSYRFVAKSFGNFRNMSLLRITLNIMIFTSVLAALNKFIQPYMADAGVPIQWFGFIYAGSLGLTALAVRYSYLLENRFGARKTMNWLSFFAVVPAVVIGLGFSSIAGVVLFFVVVIIENIRSPIANSEFHGRVKSNDRSTMGSILALSKSLGKIAILPLAGYFADAYSLPVAVLIMGVFLLFNALLFYIRKESTSNRGKAAKNT